MNRLNLPTRTLLSLSVAGLALASCGAFAGTVNPIYGGGGTLSEPSLRLWADCAGTPLSADPANYPANASFGTNCSTTKGVYSTYEYYLTAVGSGAGLISLITETAPGNLSSNGNGPGTTAGGTLSKFNSPTDAAKTAYPYPVWDFTDSDAPINSPSPLIGSSTTVNGDYNLGGAAPNGFNTKANRGLAWGIPVAATPVTIPYNPTNMNFVLTPASVDHEDHKLQLSKDALCYIYTKADSNGQVVSGAYDWSNPIFLSNTFGQTEQGPTVTNPTTLKAELYPLPLNSVYTFNSHTGAYTVTSAFSITGGTQPIVPFARSDDSGTTYLMTLWLQGNCAAFNDTTLGLATPQPNQTLVTASAFGAQVPATTITWPTWVQQSYLAAGVTTAVSGSGGMAAAVQATPGGVGYVAPTSVEPIKSGTVPTAYVENGYGGAAKPLSHQYVEPTITATEAAVTKPPAPSFATPGIINPAYGTKNTTVPHYLQGTNNQNWGSALNKLFFKSNVVGGYPITGLTYIMGYQCYQNDTGNDPYDGVLDFVAYYTNSGAGGNLDADNLLLSQGLVPIDYDNRSSTTKDAGGNFRTFTQAVYDVVATDPGTKLIPVQTGFTPPNSPSTGKPLNGPYACPQYLVDGAHE